MWTTIIELSTAYFPMLVWALAGAGVAWALFSIRNEVKMAKEKAAKAITKLDNLPCEIHKSDIRENQASADINFAELKTSLTFIKGSLDALTQSLQRQNTIVGPPFTQRHSPLSITQEGYDLAEKLGMNDMIDANWDRICRYIDESLSSSNPYDVQEFLIEQLVVYPLQFITEGDLDKIKLTSYQEGNHLLVYMNVVAILIRDRYFHEHHIKVTEADLQKHA
jgi:hypothetical protein